MLELLQPPKRVDSPGLTPRSLRVLVVDDDALIQAVIRAYLEKLNHEVTLANSANIGMEQLRAVDFDVIMSDWVMPEIDGLEFAQLAKQLRPTTPFILVTGFAEKLISRVPQGVDLLMVKPVSLEDIGHGLESVMSGEGPR